MTIQAQPQFTEFKNPPKAWTLTWIFIYALIILIGFFSPSSQLLTFIKLSGIILCFIYALLVFPKDTGLHVALFITIIADLILADNNTAEVGLLFFLCAQTTHTIRLAWHQLKKYIISFILIIIACLILNIIFHFAPLIYIICTFYVISLIANIIICWRWHTSAPSNPHAIFGLIGFLLFLSCDICTGISYLSLNSALPFFLYAPANFFAWFFYYPSQVFVSNSSKF